MLRQAALPSRKGSAEPYEAINPTRLLRIADYSPHTRGSKIRAVRKPKSVGNTGFAAVSQLRNGGPAPAGGTRSATEVGLTRSQALTLQLTDLAHTHCHAVQTELASRHRLQRSLKPAESFGTFFARENLDQ